MRLRKLQTFVNQIHILLRRLDSLLGLGIRRKFEIQPWVGDMEIVSKLKKEGVALPRRNDSSYHFLHK